jgi:2,3-bisphosphoglycerate-independent phosphoglycerate mutase
MNDEAIYRELVLKNEQKIVLLVLDGAGDIVNSQTPQTALELARTPNLDKIAPKAAMGRMLPVLPGVTPGSGPGHLALFGYDPCEVTVGRGVIEALGLDLELKPGDVAARANFCTIDAGGVITDRRAGRIPTEENRELCALLRSAIEEVEGVPVTIVAGKGHRFVVVFHGKEQGLDGGVTDTDPHLTGKPISRAESLTGAPGSKRTANVINAFYDRALPLLKGHSPANAFLLRGIAVKPPIPTLEERFGLRCAVIATYPMYKGLAQLVGMVKEDPAGEAVRDLFATFRRVREQYDFFFIHVKLTDQGGEDGDMDLKVQTIEEMDADLPELLELLNGQPDVIAITADHSTPVSMKLHSWHPVPVMIHSPVAGWDGRPRFTEREALAGSLGIFPARFLMPLLMANARKFDKFGA